MSRHDRSQPQTVELVSRYKPVAMPALVAATTIRHKIKKAPVPEIEISRVNLPAGFHWPLEIDAD